MVDVVEEVDKEVEARKEETWLEDKTCLTTVYVSLKKWYQYGFCIRDK